MDGPWTILETGRSFKTDLVGYMTVQFGSWPSTFGSNAHIYNAIDASLATFISLGNDMNFQ